MDKLVNWNDVLSTNNIVLDSNEHINLTTEWLYKIALPTVVFTSVSLALLLAAAASGWHIAFVGGFLCACVGGIAAFFVGLIALDLAQTTLNRRAAQWEEDKKALRQFQMAQLENDRTARITVKEGGTANVADTIQQVNVAQLPLTSKTISTVLAHQREFRERAARLHAEHPDDTGCELKYWLRNYGAFADYMFRDGAFITQREHAALVESLKPLGEYPIGRRQGASGRIIDAPGDGAKLIGD